MNKTLIFKSVLLSLFLITHYLWNTYLYPVHMFLYIVIINNNATINRVIRSLQGDVETTFCMPKPTGEEENFLNIIGMNQVPIVWLDVNYDYLKSR